MSHKLSPIASSQSTTRQYHFSGILCTLIARTCFVQSCAGRRDRHTGTLLPALRSLEIQVLAGSATLNGASQCTHATCGGLRPAVRLVSLVIQTTDIGSVIRQALFNHGPMVPRIVIPWRLLTCNHGYVPCYCARDGVRAHIIQPITIQILLLPLNSTFSICDCLIVFFNNHRSKCVRAIKYSSSLCPLGAQFMRIH